MLRRMIRRMLGKMAAYYMYNAILDLVRRRIRIAVPQMKTLLNP